MSKHIINIDEPYKTNKGGAGIIKPKWWKLRQIEFDSDTRENRDKNGTRRADVSPEAATTAIINVFMLKQKTSGGRQGRQPTAEIRESQPVPKIRESRFNKQPAEEPMTPKRMDEYIEIAKKQASEAKQAMKKPLATARTSPSTKTPKQVLKEKLSSVAYKATPQSMDRYKNLYTTYLINDENANKITGILAGMGTEQFKKRAPESDLVVGVADQGGKEPVYVYVKKNIGYDRKRKSKKIMLKRGKNIKTKPVVKKGGKR